MDTVAVKVGEVVVDMDKEVVSKAIETGTLEIGVDKVKAFDPKKEMVHYTKEQHETYSKNLSDEHYNNGKVVGIEMSIKQAKEENGLEFEGKTMANLLSAHKTKVEKDTGAEPSAKIKELNTDLETLRASLTEKETEFTAFKTGIAEKETRGKKDSAINTAIPSEGLIVSKDIALMALKSQFGLDLTYTEDGKAQPTINGEAKKDSLLQPVELKTLVTEGLTKLGLIKKVSGGAGGDDDITKAKEGTWEAFIKEMESKNITGLERQEEATRRQKNGTLVV